MHRVKFPACFGFVLICISLSASVALAQAFASSAPAATPVNATAITGVYNGTYRCARGPVNLKLTLVAPGDGSATGVFTFDLPANSHTRTASYTLSGTYDAATGKFRLDPVEWEPPVPSGFVMVGLDGAFNSSAEQVSGKITGGYGACTTFGATRDKAQTAALPKRPAVTPVAPPTAAAGRSAPAQAQKQQGGGWWWYCTFGPYMTSVFFYPADITTRADVDAAIQTAWSNHVTREYPNANATWGTGCTLGGTDQASTQRIHDHVRANHTGGQVIDVDWKYVPGQDTPVASGAMRLPYYCYGYNANKSIYFSDTFEVPPNTPAFPVIDGFARFVIEKYGLDPGSNGTGRWEGGVACSVGDKSKHNNEMGYKIIETGWKPKSLPPPQRP